MFIVFPSLVQGASQIFKFVVRASCPRLILREQDAYQGSKMLIKGARCSHYIIFLKNWDAPLVHAIHTKLRSIVVVRVNEIALERRNDWVLSLNAT